jgi:hypothetical protein
VQRHTVVARDAGESGDRLQGAGLVVGQHDRDQDGARGDRGGQVRRVHLAVAVDGRVGHLDPVQAPQSGASGQHRRVLRLLRDHMWTRQPGR